MHKVLHKIICLLLAAIIIGGVFQMPSYAWSSSDHVERLSSTISKMANTYGVKLEFSSQEQELLYSCSKLPDDKDFRNGITSLHGRGNYLSCQKYLWELAIAILDSKLSMSASSCTVSTFLAKHLNEQTYLTRSEKRRMARVNGSIQKLITTKVLYTSDNYELSKRKRAIKVIGFLCHLIGDTYAHCTIVPPSAINYSTYNSNLHFRKGDFTTTTYSANQKWTTFKKLIDNYDIPFFDLDNLDKNYKTIFPKNSSTPIDLTTKFDSGLLNSISSDLEASKFEDNKLFHPARFDATFTVPREVLTDFNRVLALYKNKQRINNYKSYKKGYMDYYQSNNTSYTLLKYAAYKNLINS